ncbi:MAG: hypothetical protein MJ025_04675 [Victivallaceae bacterium]|nr:hypothetical protein [Victivallaceae bacterium]
MVAGPNGAGKTTFAMKYLPTVVSCRNFVNADEIARGLSPLNVASGLLEAGKIFLKTLDRKISERHDFAFETTLTGRMYLPMIAKWRQSGWEITMFYLYIPSVEFSMARVRQRVQQGGHDIPQEDILRRYPRSLRNLFDYAEICDRTICLENTRDEIISISEKRLGQPWVIHDAELFAKLQEAANEQGSR